MTVDYTFSTMTVNNDENMLVENDGSGESLPPNDPPSPKPSSSPKVAQLPKVKPKTRHKKAPPKAPPSTPSVTTPSSPTTPESTPNNLDKKPSAKPKIVPETPYQPQILLTNVPKIGQAILPSSHHHILLHQMFKTHTHGTGT